MIRLIIADDHMLVREGLRLLVEQDHEIQVIGEAENGDQALRLARRADPDLVILDVSMPGPGVLELVRRLRHTNPRVRVLVLSVHSERDYGRRALEAGADGYVTKSSSYKDLLGAIRQVTAGRKFVAPALAQELAEWVTIGAKGDPHERLSSREYQVFLMMGAGKPVPLIGKEMRISAKTVRTYRSRILEKMQLRSTAELIVYAVRHGLVGDVPPSFKSMRQPPRARRAGRAAV